MSIHLINSKIVVFSLFHLPFNDIKGTSNLFILKATKQLWTKSKHCKFSIINILHIRKVKKNYKNDLQRDIEDNNNDHNSGCESWVWFFGRIREGLKKLDLFTFILNHPPKKGDYKTYCLLALRSFRTKACKKLLISWL